MVVNNKPALPYLDRHTMEIHVSDEDLDRIRARVFADPDARRRLVMFAASRPRRADR